MSFLANIAMERKTAPAEHRWKRFGKLWYKDDSASLLLTGVRLGTFVGRVWEDVENPPYISGDLCCFTGYIHDDLRKEYQWIGHIQTAQEHDKATMYYGAIDIMPIKAPQEGKYGIWISVRSTDTPKHEGQEPLPF